MLPVEPRVGPHDATEPRHRLVRGRHRPARAREDAGHRVVANPEEQLLLVPDVIVDPGLRHAGEARQPAHAGGREAVGREQRGGAAHHPVEARLSGHRNYTDRSVFIAALVAQDGTPVNRPRGGRQPPSSSLAMIRRWIWLVPS